MYRLTSSMHCIHETVDFCQILVTLSARKVVKNQSN
jgi:hypothetical protein